VRIRGLRWRQHRRLHRSNRDLSLSLLATFTDAAGTFLYLAGETVTYSYADVDFLPTPGAPMISPWQLAAQGQCSPSSELTLLLVLLDSLDQDADLADGLQLPETPMGTTQRSFANLVTSDVDELINAGLPGGLDGGMALDAGLPVDGGLAVIDFITEMDGEVWQQIGMDNFYVVSGEERSQGVSTDGTNWIFSWQLGFDITDQSYNTIVQNDLAIPLNLAALGVNHMGDNDYWDGGIYVGAEDGPAYQNPYVLQFDSQLNYVQGFALSPNMMDAGVPWAAVDGPNGHIIVANWTYSPVLFLLDLNTGAYVSQLPITQTLQDIQGAKLFEGSLYASTDDANQTIYKIDMETGVVIQLWQFNFNQEEEGCAFLAQASGALFHTLDVNPTNTGMEFRHHQRTRAPLRNSVCDY
jgi:hypothetical protein